MFTVEVKLPLAPLIILLLRSKPFMFQPFISLFFIKCSDWSVYKDLFSNWKQPNYTYVIPYLNNLANDERDGILFDGETTSMPKMLGPGNKINVYFETFFKNHFSIFPKYQISKSEKKYQILI